MEYTGEFKYGKKHGDGVWISHNSKVVGEFKNDMFNGKGKFTYSDGTQKIGVFKDNKFLN